MIFLSHKNHYTFRNMNLLSSSGGKGRHLLYSVDRAILDLMDKVYKNKVDNNS